MISFNNQSGFSNYYLCPIYYDNLVYTSSEAVYQSMKYTDKQIKGLFCNFTPDDARHFAHSNITDIRPDWESIKDSIMYDIVLAKFQQNKVLSELLLATGRQKLEENTTGWHDNYWGKCYCSQCKNLKASNKLGIILMQVRSELRKQKRNRG